uniref:Uncharacterized protein n=1 Tax=Leersia perrieri TaxID=77586 RepID=A0A0D9WUX8_9ORYZ
MAILEPAQSPYVPALTCPSSPTQWVVWDGNGFGSVEQPVHLTSITYSAIHLHQQVSNYHVRILWSLIPSQPVETRP